jgi:D-inositol-3-phosphate glycosyltransferase
LQIRVALLTAGKDPQYALGLAPALSDTGIELEVVGNSEMERSPQIRRPMIRFFNLRGDQSAHAHLFKKIQRVLRYYFRLVRFAWQSQSTVFHILWPNKFIFFDRTILNLYYRSLGKKLVFTAHNINTEARDKKDSSFNRASLRIHYHLMDHIFVHTQEMSQQLTTGFGVGPEKITILTFPINNVTPRTGITNTQARLELDIPPDEKIILFFGNIAEYKGLEDLIRAIPELRLRLGPFRVLIAGSVKAGAEGHFAAVLKLIKELDVSPLVDLRIDYIPEEKVELYFKSADLLVLPYRRIFQSGVLFLSYSFGLPVLVADSGSLRQEVIEGKTGFVCRPYDPADLADKVDHYFKSDLFTELEKRRDWIVKNANENHSWEKLASTTRHAYECLLEEVEDPVSTTHPSNW